MDSASTLLSKSSEPNRRLPKPSVSIRSALLFLALAGGIGWMTLRVLATDYVNADAMSRWAKVLGLAGAPVSRLENLGLLAPQIPIHILVPFYYIPGMRSGGAPYLLSAFLGAMLLGMWSGQLARRGYPRTIRALYVLLLAIHPFFLWPATSGSKQILSMFVFYALCVLLGRVADVHSARRLILSGFGLVLAFLTDERFLYLFLVLIPLLPLIMSREMLKQAPGTFYVVACTPMVFAFLGWAYLNWVFSNDAWRFLRDQESAFRGAWAIAQHVGWLSEHGGKIGTPLRWSLTIFVASFPVALLLFWRNLGDRQFVRIAGLFCALPVLGTVAATTNFMIAHPLEILIMLVPATMALISISASTRPSGHVLPLAFLLFGALGGWMSIWWSPTVEMDQWLRAAFFQQRQKERFEGEKALGEWLAKHREPTMIDDRLAYPAMVVRGDAAGLLLPFSDEFQRSIMQRAAISEQVAVPNPHAGEGAFDQINQKLPWLYETGAPGYQLVYDYMHWRVYRRVGPAYKPNLTAAR